MKKKKILSASVPTACHNFPVIGLYGLPQIVVLKLAEASGQHTAA
jgi:hypothetical protein